MTTRKEPALYNFLINSKGYSLLIFPVYPHGFDRCKSFFAGSGVGLYGGVRWVSLVYLAGCSCLFARVGKNSEVAWKVARFGRFMVPVSQFPISVIAMFVLFSAREELGGCSEGCSFAWEIYECRNTGKSVPH